MALLERVGTLLRANINDLVDQAEEPEKMIKQVILDMENQLLQVKTQVAIAIADQHLLDRKLSENLAKHGEWVRKAELAVEKGQDDLARAALERSLTAQRTAESFEQQIADQKIQVENLKTALRNLDAKLSEAQSKSDLLIARSRRARAVGKAAEAGIALGDQSKSRNFDRMEDKVLRTDATAQANAELLRDNIDERLAALERDDKIDKLLADLKQKKSLGA